MSYIANLVHRTLGVTPVAQPVIQARFAPHSQQVTVGGQDSAVAQTAAPAASIHQTSPIVAQARTISAQPEALGLHEGKSTPAGHVPEPAQSSMADLTTNESQSVFAPARPLEDPSLQPPNPPGLSVTMQAQAPETSNWSSHPAHAVEEFHLMKPAPPAPGHRQSSSTYGSTYGPAHSPSFSQPRETETAERPVVRVHIGRVDVRMVTPLTKEPRAAMPTVQDAKPASLDEYLRARQRGSR